MITPELMQRQLNLEHESITRGIEKYHRECEETPLEDQKVGLRLLQETIEPLRVAIDKIKYESVGNQKFSTLLKRLEIDSYELAYIVLKGALATRSENMMAVAACHHVASMVLDHSQYINFKLENPGYLFKMEKDFQKRSSGDQHKRSAIKAKARHLGISQSDVSQEEFLMIGQKLIDLLIEASGLFEITTKPGPDGRDRYYFESSVSMESWLEHQHEMCEVMSPFFLPMIIKPKPWTNFSNGGYYCDNITLHNTLVKTRNKDARKLLQASSMPEVYSALNAIQETPWRVNQRVLEVLTEVWESGSTLGGLPYRDDQPLPAKPWGSDDKEAGNIFKELHPEEFLAWKRSCIPVYEENKRITGKRANIQTRIRMAEKFKDESAIYYPHCLDFRGRIYPIPMVGGMQPQGDDSGKALLEFAEGKALDSKGINWLMVHGANCYGYDKDSFEGRVQWVREHHAKIIDSAENPLDGYRFWSEADSPYCFLAFCFEYADAINDASFISFLPIAMDGSCNGLQNFSAMLLDEVGGKEVNLIPQEKPADIYSKVAQHVSEIVTKEALEGHEEARLWVGKIDRKMAKRNVMTLPYGAKKYGFKDQLMAELADRPKDYLATEDHFKPAVYLADRMYNGIGDIVIAARAAMDWLQGVSTVINEAKLPITWVTPAGFLAHQKYQVQDVQRINTFWGSAKIHRKLTIKKDIDKLDTRKQTTGISPNFVHSMDACHLMKTVNRLKDSGVNTFAMIHDSYGCLAADVETLNRELREAFILMYSEHDVLQEFRDKVVSQLPKELAEKIPSVPPKGSLDLNGVRDSRYFFA